MSTRKKWDGKIYIGTLDEMPDDVTLSELVGIADDLGYNLLIEVVDASDKKQHGSEPITGALPW